MTEDEARADERRKMIALLRRAAEGKRACADGSPAPHDGDPAIYGMTLSDAFAMAARIYGAAAGLLEDPGSILLLIPAWQWTEQEHQQVMSRSGPLSEA